MEIRPINMADLTSAIALAQQEYDTERSQTNALYPMVVTNQLESLLIYLIQGQRGMAAVEDGKLLGYLAFYPPLEGLNGNNKQVFSPLGGNAYSGVNKSKLASKLFEAAADRIIKEGVSSFAICRYAHDEDVAKSYVLNGFGIRCMDAIRDLKQIIPYQETPGFIFRELDQSEFSLIKELSLGLVEHLYQSPVFCPTDLAHFMSREFPEDTRIFAAMVNDECIGYLKLSDEGENFITNHDRMMNISGAFVKKEYRGQQIAQGLLAFMQVKLREENYEYLGVDCETMNPTALRFWSKHFKPYTYSFVRRIDERVLGYDAYFHNMILKEKEKEK